MPQAIALTDRFCDSSCFMKIFRLCYRLFVPIFFASLLSFSCDRRIHEQLDSVEESLSTNPSAAYESISSISPHEIRTKASRARYALLLSLALDKSYIDVDNDSLIRVATRYYERHGSKRNRMLSMYMLGIVQRNVGNNAGAIVSFLKAKKMAEELGDYHYCGLSARNIAEMYGQCNDEDTELAYYKESVRAFECAGELQYMVYSQLGEAEAYMAKSRQESADSLLNLIGSYARSNSRTLLSRVLMDHALNNMSSENPDAKLVISLYRETDTLGVEKETSDYASLAKAYNMLGIEDSVSFYLSLAERSAFSRVDSIHLCNIKALIYSSHGDYRAANDQYTKGVELHNRMVFSRENQQLANAISDYNRQEAARQSELAGYRLHLLILSIFTTITLVIVLILVVKMRRRQLQEKNRIIQERERKIEEEVAQIQEIAEELQQSRDGSTELSKKMNALIQDKIHIVKMCADAYETVQKGHKTKDPYHYLDIDPLKEKQAQMEQFLLALEQFRTDDSLFSLLEDSVNALKSQIMVKLRAAYLPGRMEKPQFDEEDFRMLMLFYAGIPDRTIAFLMDMSCASVRTRKTRYKERLLRSDIADGSYFVQELTFSH